MPLTMSQSMAKSLQLLDLIAQGHHKLADLVHVSGMPKSTVYRLAGVPPQEWLGSPFRMGDQTIHTWSQMTGIVKENPDRQLSMEVLREGRRISLTVTPAGEQTMVNGQSVEVGKIGISGPGRGCLASMPGQRRLRGGESDVTAA
jgi:hypothetical protein